MPSNTLLENKIYYATQTQTFHDPFSQCESVRIPVTISLGTIPVKYTFIADSRFEQTLINLGYDNIIDNKVLTTNIEKVTSLDLLFAGITDLTGIKAFKSLKSIELYYNDVFNLDVSGMTSLEIINAYGNHSKSVNFLGLVNLEEVNLGNSDIKTVNLSGLTALEKLQINGQIGTLDLTDQINLIDLSCRNTNITSLNLKNKPNLGSLDAEQMDKLTCILVDDLAVANANLNWLKD